MNNIFKLNVLKVKGCQGQVPSSTVVISYEFFMTEVNELLQE